MKSTIIVLLGFVSGLVLSRIEGLKLWQELVILAVILIAIGLLNKLVLSPKNKQ
jgi:hypothetical protein